MYLLHAPSVVNSRILKLEWVPDERVQKYAILSHRWRTEQGQEVTYTDSQVYPWRWRHKVWMKKLGAAKLSLASKQACTDGLDYIWIDTCCIDKSSSQELQESLESMYNWYQGAEVCYVYLSDVPRRNLEDSRWFKRGWTLQELIAPRHSIFFDSTWKRLATKASLAKIISNITGVNAGFSVSSMLASFPNTAKA
ncbi:hypothetical protein EV356DRAFT_505539 [Viridothelium virens]|uniref:Heterokaryon incompatibility domain-containing protein n=1 Tax=Viridothelium virens TaxID=1048519 RepID=A0A6A6H235_VIRVR|nr:hypothetical protein EV356DRAFT_505539 [Viridothelium virens]